MSSINLNRLNCYPIHVVEGFKNIDYSKVLVAMFSIHLNLKFSQKAVKNHHPNAYLKSNKFLKMSSSYQSLMTGSIEFIGLVKSQSTRTVKIHHRPSY